MASSRRSNSRKRRRYQFERNGYDNQIINKYQNKCWYATEEIKNKEEDDKTNVNYMQNVDPGFVGCKGIFIYSLNM